MPNWSYPASSVNQNELFIEADSEIIIIGSDNGLSPGRHQDIIWANVGILLIGPLGINFSEILIEINTFSFKKMHLKMSSAKWRLFRLGFGVLTSSSPTNHVLNKHEGFYQYGPHVIPH